MIVKAGVRAGCAIDWVCMAKYYAKYETCASQLEKTLSGNALYEAKLKLCSPIFDEQEKKCKSGCSC